MKIFISVPKLTEKWFWNMQNLLRNSLIDCGYEITEFEAADVVIVIQHMPHSIPRDSTKKYILLQTEQSNHPTVNIENYYYFKPDMIWGFDINNKTEQYICLGYHPCLEQRFDVEQDLDIGFVGCMTQRRKSFLLNINHKFKHLPTWNYENKIQNIRRTKINLNIHSYGETKYTEWDRICLILANESFLLSEDFYCPLKIPMFNFESYDSQIDKYLNDEKLRKEIANNLYLEYKTKYDMRDILTKELKKLKGESYV